MGQAKQRGTLEQRRTEAFIREAERQERDRIARAKRAEEQRQYDLAHPKQAAQKRARIRGFNSLLSVALAVAMTPHISPPKGDSND